MTIKEYQEFAHKGILSETAKREPIVGFALGLAGEAGEVVDDIKKKYFHGRDIDTSHTAEELGDVMWYVANLATELGYDLETIMQQNKAKLESRYSSMYDKEQTLYLINGKKCYIIPRGPHQSAYECGTNKFVKHISKTEKLEVYNDVGSTEGNTESGFKVGDDDLPF